MIEDDYEKDSSTNTQLHSKTQNLRGYVSDLICQTSDEDFDAKKILEENPEVLGHRSLVLDLAYEEYCRRVETGSAVEQASFAKKFPEHEESLLRVLQVHQYLERSESSDKSRSDWPRPGDDFGEYRLLELIGRGTFAQVFVAEQSNVAGRKVVLKVTRDAVTEVETLGRLDHPNIVQIFTVESDIEGFTAICMPLISQVTLFDILGELHSRSTPPESAKDFTSALKTCLIERTMGEPPAIREVTRVSANQRFADVVLAVGIDLAEALNYSHDRGFLHCDIKPTNILVTPDGKSMLFDFNLSAKADTRTGRIGGTLPYMAPERLQALIDSDYSNEPNEAVDIFSFGVTIYQFLTGKLPFGDLPDTLSQKESAKVMLDRQKQGKVDFDGLKGLNPGFKSLLRRCLKFRPADRPHSARKLLRELKQQTSYTCQTSRKIIRYPFQWSAAFVLLMLLIPGLAIGWNWMGQASAKHISELLRKGREFQRQSKFDEAVEMFKQAEREGAHNERMRFATEAHFTMHYAAVVDKHQMSYHIQRLKRIAHLQPRLVLSMELALSKINWTDMDHAEKLQQIMSRLLEQYGELSIDDMTNYVSATRNSGVTSWTDNKRAMQKILEFDPDHAEANYHVFDYYLWENNRPPKRHNLVDAPVHLLDKAVKANGLNRVYGENYVRHYALCYRYDRSPENLETLVKYCKLAFASGVDRKFVRRYVELNVAFPPPYLMEQIESAETSPVLANELFAIGISDPLDDFDVESFIQTNGVGGFPR